jgi:hypothetical protein
MSEQQRDTAFLTQLLHHHPREERQRLQESLTKAQCNEQCVKRALALMLHVFAFSVAGLAYTTVLLQHIPDKYFDLLIKAFSVLGLGSIISFVWFVCIWVSQRNQLNERREECRQFIGKAMG